MMTRSLCRKQSTLVHGVCADDGVTRFIHGDLNQHRTTLSVQDVKPVSGPTVDGGRQFLFRRANLSGIDPKRLLSGSSKLQPRTDEDRHTAQEAKVVCDVQLENALRTELGGELSRYYNEFRNESVGLVIQAMTARNSGTLGTYLFKVTEKQRAELSGAKRAFLALGFHDRPDYLLVSFEGGRPNASVCARFAWPEWVDVASDGAR